MITLSDNNTTRALVALLHARGLIQRRPCADGRVSEWNPLHTLFDQRGLHRLRLAGPAGGAARPVVVTLAAGRRLGPGR